MSLKTQDHCLQAIDEGWGAQRTCMKSSYFFLPEVSDAN